MSSSKRQQQWGAWQYDQESSAYFRERFDHKGRRQIQWQDEVDTVPRGADVSQITEQLGHQSLEDQGTYGHEYSYGSSYPASAGYGDDPAYVHGAEHGSTGDQYAASSQKHSSHKGKQAAPKPDKHHKSGYGDNKSSSKSSSSSKVASSSKGYSSSHTSKGHSEKSRSKSRKEDENPELDPFYSQRQQDTIPEEPKGGAYSTPANEQYPEETYPASAQASSYVAYDAQSDTRGNVDPTYSHGQKAKSGHHSSRHKHGGGSRSDSQREIDPSATTGDSAWSEQGYPDPRLQGHGTQSLASYDQDPGYDDRDLQNLVDDNYLQPQSQYTHASSSAEPAYDLPDDVDDDEDDGRATPRGSRKSTGGIDLIRATGGEYEELDPRYSVQPSWKFNVGEVFKILWSEPQGQGQRNITRTTIQALTEKGEQDNQYGEKFFIGFRRFIVVATDEGHSTCVPILTYEKKACKKKGVKPQKHGIIHSIGKQTKPLDGEPKLGFTPVRMKMEVPDEKLAKESRVNYSKLVTVEHNVKVFFIGHIISDDVTIISDAVDKCWLEKRRKPKGKK